MQVILPEEERDSLETELQERGLQAMDVALASINSQCATAYDGATQRAIAAIVESMPGGWHSLDDTVRLHLRRWFDSCGVPVYGTTANRIRSMARRSARLPSVEETDQ